MKVADVEEIVRLAHVDPTQYSFVGARDEALCLVPWGQQWQVFFSERGKRYEEREFGSEDDACVHFLKQLFRTYSTS